MNHRQQTHGERKTDGTQIAATARTPSFAMQASVLSTSIEEEDFIDNIQPNLIESTSGDSCSSQIGPLASDDVGLGLDFLCKHSNSQTRDWGENDDAKPASSRSTNVLNKSAQEYSFRRNMPKAKLSLSMHDISAIPTYPLTPKSSHFSSSTIQSHSMTTNASIPKSKDSGFPRSSSCFSLNSSKSYVHVQSKVKEYIRQIKAENEAHKRNSSKSSLSTAIRPSPSEQDLGHGDAISAKELVPLIHKLKDELDDKDKMLSTLQENYDSLLLKYAESKNQIDHLRCRPHTAGVASPAPFNFDTTDYKKTQASPSLLLLPKLHELQKESCNVRLKQPHKGLQKSNSATLSPITKAYSSSVRLDKLFVHPLITSESKEDGESSLPNSTRFNLARTKRIDMHKYSESLLEQAELEVELKHHLLASKELSPERLNHQFSENPFIKVKRWQESLPSFELIDPGNNYDSLNSHTSHEDEMSDSHYFNQISSDSISSKQITARVTGTKGESSASTNASNLILSRSISQPNNCYSFDDSSVSELGLSTSGFSPSSAQFSKSLRVNFDPQCVPQSSPNASNSAADVQTVHTAESSHNATTHCRSKPSPNPSAFSQASSANRYKASASAENSHFNRKKLLGQKARLILFEYLKSSQSRSKIPFCNVYKSSSRPVKSKSESSFVALNVESGANTDASYDASYDDEDITLGECLDAMNESCTNLRGKSEAIMKVLAKQLKDSI